MWRVLSLGPKGMEIARKFIQIEGNSMRLVGHCGGLNEARIESNAPHQREFRGIIKCVIKPRGSREQLPAFPIGGGQGRGHVAGVAKNRLSPGVAVLDGEGRIVAWLLDDLGEV